MKIAILVFLCTLVAFVSSHARQFGGRGGEFRLFGGGRGHHGGHRMRHHRGGFGGRRPPFGPGPVIPDSDCDDDSGPALDLGNGDCDNDYDDGGNSFGGDDDCEDDNIKHILIGSGRKSRSV